MNSVADSRFVLRRRGGGVDFVNGGGGEKIIVLTVLTGKVLVIL